MHADQSPVELLRSFYELWSAGDYIEAATLLFDPEVELVQPPELPGGGGSYHGYEGLRRALDESLEAWDYLHAEAERFALGKDTVGVAVRDGRPQLALRDGSWEEFPLEIAR